MATKPRARKEKAKPDLALLDALKFIQVAQHTEGSPYQQHCRLTNGTLTAFDGGLTVGIFVEQSLNCCPHTVTLIKALSRCEEQITITLMDTGKLSIKSGKFRAVVPCAPFETILTGEPDPPCAILTDDLKPALLACLGVAEDGSPPPACGVLLDASCVVATDRFVFIQAWHGINLPRIFMPRVSAKAIAECLKPLKAFGFSEMSATFYFDDDSFIKTQLFADTFPDYSRITDIEANPWPLPGGFYEGLERIAPFAEKYVYFIDGKMSSSENLTDATTYDVEGLKNGLAFNIEQLKTIRPFVDKMHFGASESTSLFFSQNGLVRGAITRIGNDK